MEKEVVKNHQPQSHTTNNISTTSTANFGLQWGSRKRLRCMKIQAKNESTTTVARTTVRVDRRVIRTDGSNNNDVAVGSSGNHLNNGHFNLRQRLGSPAQLPARALRNTESASPMKGHQNNGNKRGVASPDRVDKKGGTHHNHENGGGGRATSSETKNGSSSGGGSDVVWPPKFNIALTNKEKEEDFMAIKGSKLPHRPKKRAKFIQRTLNLVSPGGWLCDLTLERYEVREKKISKKRPRGLKAMSNYMDSDSE